MADDKDAQKKNRKPVKNGDEKKQNPYEEQRERLFFRTLSPQQRVKAGVLGMTTIIISIGAWQLLRATLGFDLTAVGFSDVWFVMLMALILFMLTIAFVSIIGLLISDKLVARGILILAALGPIFAFGLPLYALIAFLVLTLAYLHYDWQIKNEESMRIRFSVKKSIRYGLNLTIALTLLAISFSFYGYTVAKKDLSTSTLDTIIEFSGNTVNQWLALQVEEYNPRETFDMFISRLVAKQITGQTPQEGEEAKEPQAEEELDFSALLNPDTITQVLNNVDLQEAIDALPEEVRAQDLASLSTEEVASIIQVDGGQAYDDVIAKLRAEFLTTLDIEAEADTPMGEVVKRIISNFLRDRLGPYEHFFPPILALSLFFVLSIFTFLYSLIIRGLAQLVTSILIATHVVHVVQRDAKIEMLVLEDNDA